MITDLQRIIDALEYQYDGTDNHEEHQRNMTLAAEIRELEVQFKKNSTVAPVGLKDHQAFCMVGRDWYARFSVFHDSCQFDGLSWTEKTVRLQGYEHGWNDAQRYLKEVYVSTPPKPPNYKPVPPTSTNNSLDY